MNVLPGSSVTDALACGCGNIDRVGLACGGGLGNSDLIGVRGVDCVKDWPNVWALAGVFGEKSCGVSYGDRGTVAARMALAWRRRRITNIAIDAIESAPAAAPTPMPACAPDDKVCCVGSSV